MRRQEDDLAAVGDSHAYQLVIRVDADGDDAARHHVAEVLQRRLLHRALLRREEDELAFFFQIAHRQNSPHRLARQQVQQAGNRLALTRRANIRHLINLQPVNPPGIGEAQQVGMGRIDDQLRDKIFLARLHPQCARPAAPLLAIGRDRRPLQISRMRNRHRNLLVGDQVFQLQLRALVDESACAAHRRKAS